MGSGEVVQENASCLSIDTVQAMELIVQPRGEGGVKERRFRFSSSGVQAQSLYLALEFNQSNDSFRLSLQFTLVNL